MDVCCECCVLSGRGLCDELIIRPGESYRVWCVWVWSWSREKWGSLGPQEAVEPLKKNTLKNKYPFTECWQNWRLEAARYARTLEGYVLLANQIYSPLNIITNLKGLISVRPTHVRVYCTQIARLNLQ
jgi:hypothetical protein